MAKEDEWLRLDRRLGAILAIVTMVGGEMMCLEVIPSVPPSVGVVGLVLFGCGLGGIGSADFRLSRRHGLGFWRSGFLATKTAVRALFTFMP
jgi:hypothetical protein